MKTRAAVAFAARRLVEIVAPDRDGPRAGEMLIGIMATGIMATGICLDGTMMSVRLEGPSR